MRHYNIPSDPTAQTIFYNITMGRYLNILNNCASDRYRMIYLTLITGVFYTAHSRTTRVGGVTLVLLLRVVYMLYIIMTIGTTA